MDNKKTRFSSQNWISASFILVSISLLSKVFGFVRDILLAKYFGTGAEMDSFMVAISLLMMIGGGLGFALSTAMVPMYRKIHAGIGEIKANEVAGNLVTLTPLITIIFLLPICIIPLTFVKLVAPSLPETTSQLAAELTRWLAFYILGLNMVYVLTSFYHAFHHFKIPAFTDLLFNIVVILVLMTLAVSWGIHSLVFGNIFGIFLCASILLTFLIKRHLPGFRLNLQTWEIKSFFLLVIPILLFDISCQVGAVIENYFASGLAEGSIAALTFAKRLCVSIIAIVAINISRGVFPTFSTLYYEQNRDSARDLFVKLNKQIIILFVPLTILFIFFRKEIIQVVFMRGAFDLTALKITSTAFLFYSIGLVIAAIEPIFLRACYAFSITIAPLFSTVISVLLIIPLNYFLTPILGIAGIALTTNIGFLFRLMIQAIWLRKKLGGLAIGELSKSLALSLLCAMIAILPILIFRSDNLLKLLISMLMFIIIYFSIGWFVMKKELKNMLRLLRQNIAFVSSKT